MDFGQIRQQNKENAKFSMYQNIGYDFERNQRKTLIIDNKIGTTITSINIPLYEPLTIYKLSDVYLESFTTYDALVNTDTEKIAFVVNIPELNIKSNSSRYSTGTTTSTTFNKLIIPNEDNQGSNKTVIHKSKKLNYISQINPCKLVNITIQITDLNSTPATMFDSDGRIIMELVFVARD